MGDMADFINDDGWDSQDGYEPAMVSCRYCKRDGFYWMEFETGWRLATSTGKVHSCKAYAKHHTTHS